MNYIKVTYGVGNSFIKSTFEDNSTYVKTSVNSTFIKVAYDGGDAGLDAERLRTKVYNVTGGTIAKGTVVYINGSHGNLPSVAKAIATSDATSAQTFGLVLDDIVDNKSGYIILAGKLSDLDTQAIAAGSQLYLSSTVAGAYTTTKQYAPAHLVYVGIVNRSHPTQGEIEVKIQNGYEADEIHDFAVRNPSNNDGIFFNSTTSLWEKKQISSALGYTPVPTSRTITINGVSYDLSADRSYTIAAGISGSGTSGQVAFWNGASSLTGSADFTWDSNNLAFGNGKGVSVKVSGTNRATSVTPLNIVDNFAGISFYPTSGTNVGQSFNVTPRGTGYSATIKAQFTVANTDLVADPTNYEAATIRAAGSAFTFASGKGGTGTLRPILLSAGFVDGVTNPNQLWIYTSGNIGLSTTSDDGINRLQVSGKAKVTGDMTISGMTVGIGSGNVGTNVVIGPSTFISNTSGQHNIAIGYASLYSNTVGNQNVSIGLSSMVSNSSGDNNVAIGMSSLQSNLNGYNNTAIGYSAGYSTIANSNTVGANNIFIGFESIGESSLESNRTWIGNTATTSTWVGGNLLVGTRTNGSEKLQVVGNAKITGSLNVNNGIASYLYLGAGYIESITTSSVTNVVYGTRTVNIGTGIASGSYTINLTNYNTYAGTSGTINHLNASVTFAPTSGNAIVNTITATPTINQTGGANGITRGVYVAPTLTSAFDWRSIQWDNNSGWGLYGAGTASNYINGNLTIGSTSNPSGEKFIAWGNVRLGLVGSRVVFVDGYNNYIIANRLHLYDTPTNIRGINSGNQGMIVSKSTGLSDLYPSSIFAIDSTNQGFLPPRMTTTQKNAIATPTAGLVVYDTTLNKLCVYTTTWETITSI